MRGTPDLFGRTLEVTFVGLADEVAAAASLLQGQTGEGRPVVILRGLQWSAPDCPASEGRFRPEQEICSGDRGSFGRDRRGQARPRPQPRPAARAATVIANIGDDFDHLGLRISPDIDTLTQILAGLDNQELGWGRRDETGRSWRR